MPASKQTAHGLNLWTADDHPLREDFVSDNQTIEDLFGKHIADTTLHKTPTDQTPLVYGNYTGNGSSLQTITLGFNPQAVLVFPFKAQMVQKDSSGNLVLYSGVAANGLYCGPLYLMQNQGFSVKNEAVSADIYSMLNENDKVYAYIAFR